MARREHSPSDHLCEIVPEKRPSWKLTHYPPERVQDDREPGTIATLYLSTPLACRTMVPA
jgi:hypothetical protein